MAHKTPTRSTNQQNSGFVPLQIFQSPAAGSPQKNLTGPPRIARDLTADLYNNIQKWNDFHVKGAQIVKQIAILKSDEPKKYSPELEEYVNNLYDILKVLATYKKCFELLNTQVEALAKLQRDDVPLFVSRKAMDFVPLVNTVVNAYLEEFKIKEMVLENIAHARNKDEVMFFAACWTLQMNITSIVNLRLETLLIETGHRTFS